MSSGGPILKKEMPIRTVDVDFTKDLSPVIKTRSTSKEREEPKAGISVSSKDILS